MPSWMKSVVAAISLILALPVLWLGVAALSELWFTWTYCYRLELVVSIDGKDYTGEGVVGVHVVEKSELLPQRRGVSVGFSGEAVAVDLGERGTLFATLKDIQRPHSTSGMWLASPDYIVQSAFPRIMGEEGEKGLRRAIHRYAQGGQRLELRPDQLPLLVRFRDIASPITVEQVDPTNLEPQFGPGARLTRASIETVPSGWFPFNLLSLSSPQCLTGSPVTKTIDERLPWLESYRNQRLDGSRYERSDATNRLANSLSAGHFKAWR